MSLITLKEIKGLSSNLNTIELTPGSKLVGESDSNLIYQPGDIIQVKKIRSDYRTTYSAPVGGVGNPISALNLNITPKSINSKLLLQWQFMGEMHYDTVFTVLKNGATISIGGEEGYNAETTGRWSGIAAGQYDQDLASTPNQWFIQYMVTSSPGGVLEPSIYSLAVRASGGTAYTLYLNRTQNSLGQNGYENGISTGIIWEIAQ